MAAATADTTQQQTPARAIPMRTAGMKLDTGSPPRIDALKISANAHIMSPVNQNGSFEFDRVIKAGTAVKRTRKTKQWKPVYMVLRPNLLSIYRGTSETKLRHQITLSDITAVARQRDSKKKMAHVFGIFSPARNWHLGATTEKDAQEWVDLIRAEARIDQADEEEMVLMSPTVERTFGPFDRARRDNVGSSSSEAERRPSSSVAPEHMHSATQRPAHGLQYAGNECGSFSDFSDTGGPVQAGFQSSVSLPRTSTNAAHPPEHPNNPSTTPDDERVIFHGWLHVLKSKGGVRQWKKVWVVLRPKALGLYKNDNEYSAMLILPFDSIIDAVDIDPASKSKEHCMQVISEEKNLRFCAPDENTLAKWLGAFKSLLVKRKEAEHHRLLKNNTADTAPAPPPKHAPLPVALKT